ncbi:MAG: hypothetical protein U1F56_06690 [Rubrivivax sp.]
MTPVPVPRSKATPNLILGPYYPARPAADADHRLWRGAAPDTGARRLHVQGQVLSTAGLPVAGSDVELWHADPFGRYPHASAAGHEQVAPGFVGYGRVRSGADGGFAFESLVPGAYEGPDGLRAVHLHFQITGSIDRVVTQVFLPDDPARESDHWYRAASRRQMLLARVLRDDPEALHLRWTAILNRG